MAAVGMIDPMLRLRMAQWIVNQEARRDKHGNIKLYLLPANDGGGKYEYAGINQKYHPKALRQIVQMVHVGDHKAAEAFAVAYIANYTDAVVKWQLHPAVELFLRDTVFNRGPTGAAIIMQMALGVKADGIVGPKTRTAIAKLKDTPHTFLLQLREAREKYEDMVAPNRPNLRKGLTNRWNAALEAAQQLA